MTTLKGHALIQEGAVRFDEAGCATRVDLELDLPLHAKCECGALSEPGISRSAAKRWHRVHKDEIRQAQS